MTKSLAHLAIDLGASSGRVMLGRFDGKRVVLDELHRFSNDPVLLPEGLCWDAPRLFHECMTGITAAKSHDLRGIAVDTWGVDFGLLDRDGGLIGLPFHYRDPRTDGILPRAFDRMSRSALWQATGCQAVPLTTLNQLLAAQGSARLASAERLLLLPDLFTYWLSGEIGTERTNASTTGMATPGAVSWADDVLNAFGVPTPLLGPITPPGTHRGRLRTPLMTALGLRADVPIYATASHDTASAFAAAPTADSSLVISSGTWSLVGCLLPGPLLDPRADEAGFTNEAAFGGGVRFLKGVPGLWLLEECRRHWARSGIHHDYAELVDLAEAAVPLRALIDPSDQRFLAPTDMPASIAGFCRETGQHVPIQIGETVRCVLESIALSYRHVLGDIEALTGRSFPAIHIVGGGSRNPLLCQLTADATGRVVLAGPAEATALGNVLVQLHAAGELDGGDDVRAIAAASSNLQRYEPCGSADAWHAAAARIRQLIEVPHATNA